MSEIDHVIISVTIQARRPKWVGQLALLRAEESFLPRRVALAELKRFGGAGHPGGIFQDAPKGARVSVEELVELARDQQFWGSLVGCMKKEIVK